MAESEATTLNIETLAGASLRFMELADASMRGETADALRLAACIAESRVVAQPCCRDCRDGSQAGRRRHRPRLA